jgi:anti-sigma B factor antagonist
VLTEECQVADPFSIFSTFQGDVARVCVSGEIDLAGAPSLVEHVGALIDGGVQTTIVIDVLNASFVDASGVGALVQLKTCAEAAGRALCVVGVHGQIARVLALVGVADFLSGLVDLKDNCGEVVAAR